MGAKFYRGADKPKKFRKRFSQTRSWFRTLKWVACMLLNIFQFIKLIFYLYRSCSSIMGNRTSFQGFMGSFNWSTCPSRS